MHVTTPAPLGRERPRLAPPHLGGCVVLHKIRRRILWPQCTTVEPCNRLLAPTHKGRLSCLDVLWVEVRFA